MKKLSLALVSVMAFLSSTVFAAEGVAERIEANLQKIDNRIQVKSIGESPLKGMHEVELASGEVLYADDNGEYFMLGKLYQFSDEKGFVNLTERKQNAHRKATIDKVDAEQMVVYAPKGDVKATVSIFTDVDCPYCRKLHAEIPELNKMGIQVNYLAFPRNGSGTATYKEMVSIWCAKGADGRREAMDVAKTGGTPEPVECNNPVMEQLAMGQMLGVTGTPAMVFEDGRLVPGYVPAAQLAKMLDVQ